MYTFCYEINMVERYPFISSPQPSGHSILHGPPASVGVSSLPAELWPDHQLWISALNRASWWYRNKTLASYSQTLGRLKSRRLLKTTVRTSSWSLNGLKSSWKAESDWSYNLWTDPVWRSKLLSNVCGDVLPSSLHEGVTFIHTDVVYSNWSSCHAMMTYAPRASALRERQAYAHSW